MLLAFTLVLPVIYGVWYSLHEVKYGVATEFIGLVNYKDVLGNSRLVYEVGVTVVFTVSSLVLTVVIALALALWIDRLPLHMSLVMQMLIIIPWILSSVVATLFFKWVFVNSNGLVSYISLLTGMNPPNILSSTFGAMGALVGVTTWKRAGYALLILVAGLKAIPKEYEEAAKIDGANFFQIFRYITLPQLKTPLMLVSVVLTLSAINTVESPLIMTGGGPAGSTKVLPLEIYEKAFAQYDFGGATTLALVVFAVNIILVILYVKMTKWKV